MDLLLHLENFVAVTEVMSFSHAADDLGIAQPLLSRRIKALEEHLGGPLFDRGKRQIGMTELGLLLLPHAKDLLARSHRLLGVVRTARSSAPLLVAIPPDCDPRLLARAIQAAADHAVVLRLTELPAADRPATITGNPNAMAVVRVAPEQAPLRVRLGLAGTPAPGSPGRPTHLDVLRPRRGMSGTARTLLVTAEDAIPVAVQSLRRALARAGLPESCLRWVGSSAAALAETLAGTGLLLCSEQFARRHHVPWTPLADPSLSRGYELLAASDLATAGVGDWLGPLLFTAVGAGRAGAETAAPDGTAGRLLATSG